MDVALDTFGFFIISWISSTIVWLRFTLAKTRFGGCSQQYRTSTSEWYLSWGFVVLGIINTFHSVESTLWFHTKSQKKHVLFSVFSQTLLPDFSTQPHPTTRLRILCLKRSLQVQETPRHTTTTTLPWIIRWTTKTILQTIWSVLRPRYIRIKIK